MISQEDLFDFFQKISEELYSNGYPILDNIIHPFPGVRFREDILKEEVKNNFDSDDSLTSGDEQEAPADKLE
jgi:hypothetical protein